MVAGRGGAVGATIARRAGGARARPCTQKAIDLGNWLPRCPAGFVMPRRPAAGGRRGAPARVAHFVVANVVSGHARRGPCDQVSRASSPDVARKRSHLAAALASRVLPQCSSCDRLS
jgi:hypothetical protein